jgi:linoleate 10R-lipoxygenase
MPTISPIQAFTLGADAAYLAKRPLPIAPDGHYDWETSANANLSPEGHSGITNIINQVFLFFLGECFPPELISVI